MFRDIVFASSRQDKTISRHMCCLRVDSVIIIYMQAYVMVLLQKQYYLIKFAALL